MNTSEKEVLILKENTEYLLADKYRCLLFLYKNRNMLTGIIWLNFRIKIKIDIKINGQMP